MEQYEGFLNKIIWPPKRERKKIVCGNGDEFPANTPITGFKAFWIVQLQDLEEYEQQVFVWKREVILNLN